MELASLTALALPLALGAALLRLAAPSRDDDRAAFLAWAWILGALAVGAVMHVWLLLELPLRGREPVLAVAALAAAGWVAVLRRRRRVPEPARPAGSVTRARSRALGTAVLLAAVLATPLDRTVLSFRESALDGDEAHIWSARAKSWWEAGGFNGRFHDDCTPIGDLTPAFVQHPEYPPLNPLLQLWSFANAGRIQHRANRLPVQASVFAALLLLFSKLRRALHPLAAAGIALAVAGTEVFELCCRAGLSDVMVGFGFLAALAAGQEWRKTGDAASWRRMCLALAFMLATKREAYAMLAAIAAAAAAAAILGHGRSGPARGLRRREIAWLLIPAAAFAATALVNRRFGFESDLLSGEGGGLGAMLARLGERITPVGTYLLDAYFLSPEKTRLLPLAFAVLAAAAVRLRGLEAPGAAALAVVLVLAADVWFLATHPADIHWELEVAGSRVLGQVLPAMAWWSGLALAAAMPALRARPAPETPVTVSAAAAP